MLSKSRQNSLKCVFKSTTFPCCLAMSKVSEKPPNAPPIQSQRRPNEQSQHVLTYRKSKYISHRWLMISVARNQLSYTGWVYKGQQLVCVGSSNLNWGRFLNSVIFKTCETTFRAPGDSQHRCNVSYCAQKNTQMDEDFDLFLKILL